MTYQELRQKYPEFVYEKYEYKFTNKGLEIRFFCSISEHKFTHKIYITPRPPLKLRGDVRQDEGDIDNLIFNLGLSLIPSYWKTTCSPFIEIRAGRLAMSEVEWWRKLFIKGMGEYFYKNKIDFTAPDFLTINSNTSGNFMTMNDHRMTMNDKILVPLGGGKDSIVTLELLKPKYQIIPFIINPVPIMLDICKTANLHPLTVTSTLDPHLLDMNRKGFLNGHVPVSAFYAFCAVLTAYLLDIPHVAFSNERSSEEGNVEYLGRTINHQYSKTLEFESDLSEYIKNINIKIKNFSFLRPLYELQITKLFCNYPQYFKVFSSCNQNFILIPNAQCLVPKWCTRCPKCVSTALMLGCFIGKAKVAEIMGSYPPDLPINKSLINELTGVSPTKPFECVLTRAEAIASLSGKSLDKILSSWKDNPNIPQGFEKILKEAII